MLIFIKKKDMTKMERLKGFVKIDCIDYSPNGLVVTGINKFNAMEMLRGCTAKQLSDFAQSKFGFGIHFPDAVTVNAINADTYAFTTRVAEQLEQAGLDERTAWSQALNTVQHMSFSKPSIYWTAVPQ
jgi:hypothetical protein